MLQVLRTHTLKPEGLSEEEFFAFCVANKELRIERNRKGEIIIMPPTGSETGIFDLSLGSEIAFWNKQHKLGKTFGSSAGFTLPDGSVRSADVAWVSNDRWQLVPEIDRKRFAHICPDFVAEIKSPSDSIKDLRVKDLWEKMREWMENGCRLGWLINPEDRTYQVYTPDNHQPEALPLGGVKGGEVLPGLEIDLNEVIGY